MKLAPVRYDLRLSLEQRQRLGRVPKAERVQLAAFVRTRFSVLLDVWETMTVKEKAAARPYARNKSA